MTSHDQPFIARDGRPVTLRRAAAADHTAIAALLRSSELPLDGVGEWLERFWLAEAASGVIAAAGMERYGDSGLLRSVAVAREWRSSGLGRALIERVLEDGRRGGIRDVYLLTTTAEPYFRRLGFARVGRETVPAPLQASAELSGACPASAVVMRQAVTD